MNYPAIFIQDIVEIVLAKILLSKTAHSAS